MKKTITTWLAGVTVLFALGAALPAMAADEVKPAAAAPAASAAPAAPAPEAAAPAAAAPAASAAPAAAAGAAPAAAPAAAAPAPTANKGDTAWMMTSTLLVIMMSIPGLALFYGGLVRSKNMLSILLQVFMIFSVIIVLWCIFGYSLAFTEGNVFTCNLVGLLLLGASRPL